MTLRSTLILPLLCLALIACTRKAPNPEIEKAKVKISEIEEQLRDFDKRIKEAESDAGLKHRLLEEKELTRSRLERLKTQVGGSTEPAPHH